MIYLYSIENGEINFNKLNNLIIKYNDNTEYLYDLIYSLCKINNIKKCIIEIELSNKIVNFNKKSLKTIMIILDNNNNNEKLLITNNFNFEKYKFKNFEDIDNSLITLIEKNKIIIYDNDNIVKKIGTDNNNINLLYINIYHDDLKINHNNNNDNFKLFENLQIKNLNFENQIINEEEFENILYDNHNYEIKYENVYLIFNIDKYKIDIINNYDKDLLPLLDKNIEMDIKNKLYRIKLYKKVLTEEICNWLIYEYEKNNVYVKKSIYKNYENILNVKEIPSILSYILYFSSFLLNQIYNDYLLKNTQNFYPYEIFICKYIGSNNFDPEIDNHKFYEKKELNMDNSIISINIQLNSNNLYISNDLCILDENYNHNTIIMDINDGIKMEIGDAIVYNGRKKRTSGNVIAGSKYILTFFMKLKI